MTCVLCEPLTEDEVYTAEFWRVIVNYNQNKLGKVMVVLRRHDEDICNLTDEEVLELWAVLGRLKSALVSLFQADHFNYSFLMNLDAHVHLHVIPRYCSARSFAGIEFEDSDDIPVRRLPQSSHNEVVAALRDSLSHTANTTGT